MSLTVDDIVDFENECKACGVNSRVIGSRYCESCKAALD